MKLTVIKFAKPYPPYVIGDVASFSEEEAAAILNAKDVDDKPLGYATKVKDIDTEKAELTEAERLAAEKKAAKEAEKAAAKKAEEEAKAKAEAEKKAAEGK